MILLTFLFIYLLLYSSFHRHIWSSKRSPILIKKICVSQSAGSSHTGRAANFCGLKYVDYDIYVDIDNISHGLQKLIDKRPEFHDILSTGWQRCTITGGESLLHDQSNQDHSTVDFGLKDSKLLMYDKLLCDDQLPSQVYEQYKDDYTIFRDKLGFNMHTDCIHLNISKGKTSSYKDYPSHHVNSTTMIKPEDLAPPWHELKGWTWRTCDGNSCSSKCC